MNKKVLKQALTGGVVWGGAMFVFTLASVFFKGYGSAFLNTVGSIYPGYSISVIGSFVGFLYGFLDAFIGVYVIVWVYRHISA